MDGKTLRDHLENWERQNRQRHPMLADAPQLPAGCLVLWRDFTALHSARGASGFSPARISFSDIDAYQRVNDTRLHAWEIEAIRRADNAYLAHYAETHKRKGSK